MHPHSVYSVYSAAGGREGLREEESGEGKGSREEGKKSEDTKTWRRGIA